MMKKVTMFVWNHFTNDARVMRECLTLSQNGYDVNLIGIANKKIPEAIPYEEINQNFKVHRVPMYPKTLEYYFKRKKRVTAITAGATALMSPLLYKYSKSSLVLMLSTLIATGVILKNNSLRQNTVKLIRSLRMILKGIQLKADIYHSNDLNTLAQGVICTILHDSQLVYDSHEVQTDRTGYNPDTVKLVEKNLIKFAAETIVENATRAKKHEELYGYLPKTLHNYSKFYEIDKVSDVDLYEMLDIDRSKKILLYQGGVQFGRGLNVLINSMECIENGVLVIIGDGKLKADLMEETSKRDLTDKVKFLPKVPLEDLPSYTKQAYIGYQVLQNTSYNHYSASSNKLFEYIMAEVPVVSCDFPEIKRVVEEENIGLIVDTEKPESIAAATQKIVDNPELRNELSMNCRSAKFKYNWENEKEELLNIYKELSN
ncbi:glycosyltransferase [Jeotgalicoccus psychrophilus]|uniref:glycosyltransferase n=1 Tax=Jeotgalicoccus psychrophilus TaxID=157228 RepID=UPI001FE0248E|nr:glycosyltransferase [Jeotgalicoccus psychrophilus]